ncbi:MAG TPA: class I SAM-dependent methyltransferase [Mycobacterium sp.]|nr:class I SAM-dependent methyltransferase [Mycobacterium sp.]
MWDERYQGEDFAYGTAPNDFLRSQVEHLPAGRVLCLAEGEGRNAVFLAEQGFTVTAVDLSPVGLAKAERLATQRGVRIETVVADLAAFHIDPKSWDGIVSIFAHTPPPVRLHVHRQVAGGLKTGGVFLLESYRPEQLQYKTGGPPVVEMMMDLSGLRAELAGLDFEYAEETVRDIQEGTLHHGQGAVVQLRARKP